MSYKIYELIKPEILTKLERDGYSIKTRELIALEEVYSSFENALDWSYDTELEARNAIKKNKENLKNRDLVILNILSVNYKGEIE